MMSRTSAITAGTAIAAAATIMTQAEGHIMQKYPMSRQLSYTTEYKAWDDPDVEFCPHCYNAKGPKFVEQRSKDNTDSAILAEYGGGEEFPLYYGEFADNGNYLESDEIAVRHGICGDPEQNAEEGSNRYSTPNIHWDVLDSFESGQVLEFDIVMNAYHWGHCEFFVCNTDEMEDPDGLPTQECFNKHPLTRAPDDDPASPIDPAYPGRYYVDPECRAEETAQSSNSIEGYNIKMRYVLPNIECDHCILQMVYYTGNTCKHVGYDEFNPPVWPSDCAPSKEDWIKLDRYICGTHSQYPEEFWSCSDFSLKAGGSGSSPTPPSASEDEANHTTDETETDASATTSATDETTVPTTPSSDDSEEDDDHDDNDDGADPFSSGDEEGMVMYKYLGCFSDKKEDRVLGDMAISNSMSTEYCYNYCSEKGAAFMATQFGRECFCSNNEDLDYERHGPTDCDHHCSGNVGEICGGFDAFSLYELRTDMEMQQSTSEETASGEESTSEDEDECNEAYDQCGGETWTGSTCCPDGYHCTGPDKWYKQCRPLR